MVSVADIARLVDLSAVRADCNASEIVSLAALAREVSPVAVFTLPCFTSLIQELLSDRKDILIGGVVGFPSGGHSTKVKASEASELVALGCRELDMVINIGWLKSSRDRDVVSDIAAVVNAAHGLPVKVILECHYLSQQEIRHGSKLCVEAGAAFVKTGTGWAPTGATIANVRLIRDAIGESARIKAAGGIADLETLLSMRQAGANRFGIGLRSARSIFAACEPCRAVRSADSRRDRR